MENLIKNYFTFFSKKDISSLDKLLADNVKLIDWEISANGKKEVLDANKKILIVVALILYLLYKIMGGWI